jgi:hypothetical protein
MHFWLNIIHSHVYGAAFFFAYICYSINAFYNLEKQCCAYVASYHLFQLVISVVQYINFLNSQFLILCG